MNVLTHFPKLDQIKKNVTQRRLAWSVYKSAHPLIRHRKQSGSEIINFIKQNATSGSVVSVDSGPTSMLQFNVDKQYEFKSSEFFWSKVGIPIDYIDKISDLNYTTKYNNVLACGTTIFKYKNIDQCIDTLLELGQLLDSPGTMIVTLPITVMLFHRLKYNYKQIIEIIDNSLSKFGYTIVNSTFDIDIYLIVVKKI
jgi:hypothetical protein